LKLDENNPCSNPLSREQPVFEHGLFSSSASSVVHQCIKHGVESSNPLKLDEKLETRREQPVFEPAEPENAAKSNDKSWLNFCEETNILSF
jgi:hypothetical protein